MGKYSRKHMIEFAKFAKSYQSSKNVEDAYDAYLKGVRHAKNKKESIYYKFLRANIVYLDGKIIRNRYCETKSKFKSEDIFNNQKIVIKSWDVKSRILVLETYNEEWKELVSEIQTYLKSCGYTWSIDGIVEQYHKRKRNEYISYTAKDVMEKFESKLDKFYNNEKR